MTSSEKIALFEKEIAYMEIENIKDFFKQAITIVPDYFFEVPAASSGKFHSVLECGFGGLVYHTRSVAKVANYLVNLQQYKSKLNEVERDCVICAALLHDCLKHDWVEEMNRREGRRAPIVICGGQDKHVPFDPLAKGLCAMAASVILTGEARGQILDALNACPDYDPKALPVTVIPDYREAMETACRQASDGDTILLSPACTSFDAFKNFAERGEVFRGIVKDL